MEKSDIIEELEKSQLAVEKTAFDAINASDKAMDVIKRAINAADNEQIRKILENILGMSLEVCNVVGELENKIDAHRDAIEKFREWMPI